jgi:hypothetical protein
MFAVTSMLAIAALELTPDNWDKEVAGKSAFIKVCAPRRAPLPVCAHATLTPRCCSVPRPLVRPLQKDEAGLGLPRG